MISSYAIASYGTCMEIMCSTLINIGPSVPLHIALHELFLHMQ